MTGFGLRSSRILLRCTDRLPALVCSRSSTGRQPGHRCAMRWPVWRSTKMTKSSPLLESALQRTSFREEIAVAAAQVFARHGYLCGDRRSAGTDQDATDRDLGCRDAAVGDRPFVTRSCRTPARREMSWLPTCSIPRRWSASVPFEVLGELRDRSATALLRSMATNDREDRVSQAVNESLDKLDRLADFVPKEVDRDSRRHTAN